MRKRPISYIIQQSFHTNDIYMTFIYLALFCNQERVFLYLRAGLEYGKDCHSHRVPISYIIQQQFHANALIELTGTTSFV